MPTQSLDVMTRRSFTFCKESVSLWIHFTLWQEDEVTAHEK